MTSFSGVSFARTTTLSQSDALLRQIQTTNRDLQQALEEVSTGERVRKPSDDPSRISAIQYLRRSLSELGQQNKNLQQATGVLNNADTTLNEASTIVQEAHSLALSQIGVSSDRETREATASVVDSQLKAMLDLANRAYNGIYLFGGKDYGPEDGPLFEDFAGGIRFNGSGDALQLDVGAAGPETFNASGADVFGAFNSTIQSQVDLDPQAAAYVSLDDIGGAIGGGFARGSIRLDVDGTQVSVDLTDAATLGDVETRINAAIQAIDPAAGSLAIAGQGFDLTANAGHSVTLSDAGANRTAASLGLDLSAASATVAGGDVDVKLTDQTRVADLGVAVDLAAGLRVTQGEQTAVADFSSAQTVQDMRNAVAGLGLGVRLDINAGGDGFDFVSEVSGLTLSVGENGGTTADDLGVRSFGPDTPLEVFRNGLGVEIKAGEADFAINLHDGTSFEVDLTGAQDVQDVLDAIDAAASGAGFTPGVEYSAGLALTGNGFVLTDNTTGAGDFSVTQLNNSLAASHLGIYENVGASNSLAGQDNATRRADNVFTHLADLRDALKNNDESGITLAGGRLEDDLDAVVKSQAIVGVQSARLEDQKTTLEDRELMEKTMLSEMQDADLSEAITRYTNLQTQLEAAMTAGSMSRQRSLLDFLS